jgi:hypothetical protein
MSFPGLRCEWRAGLIFSGNPKARSRLTEMLCIDELFKNRHFDPEIMTEEEF